MAGETSGSAYMIGADSCWAMCRTAAMLGRLATIENDRPENTYSRLPRLVETSSLGSHLATFSSLSTLNDRFQGGPWFDRMRMVNVHCFWETMMPV